MAERVMAEIADALQARYELCAVAIHHRIGRVEIGETSVVIAVSAAHRQARARRLQGRDRRIEGTRAALEEGGLRGRRGMDRTGLMSGDLDLRDYEPIQPRGTDWRGRIKRFVGPIAAGAIALAKFSFVLVKFSTIFIAVAAYALIWGWKFAIGLVAPDPAARDRPLRRGEARGLHPKLPVFIPFLGAYVQYTRGNPWQTARVAIAGPILGGAASFVCYLIGKSQRVRS